ncbi:hypothetical protein ACTA71_012142 [Dictyostelium dimigraforme]
MNGRITIEIRSIIPTIISATSTPTIPTNATPVNNSGGGVNSVNLMSPAQTPKNLSLQSQTPFNISSVPDLSTLANHPLLLLLSQFVNPSNSTTPIQPTPSQQSQPLPPQQ